MNFCLTPPPPKPDDINKDIDAFGRKINLREYHAPDNLDKIEQSIHRPTILGKLSQRGRHGGHYRSSREPYLNSHVDNLRQHTNKRLLHHHRFQRNDLTKREKAALERLRANPDIIIKPADKGEATVILNKEDYITEAMQQLGNEEHYNKLDTDLTLYYERIINQGTSELINNGDLEMETGQLLRPAILENSNFLHASKDPQTKQPWATCCFIRKQSHRKIIRICGRVLETISGTITIANKGHHRFRQATKKDG